MDAEAKKRKVGEEEEQGVLLPGLPDDNVTLFCILTRLQVWDMARLRGVSRRWRHALHGLSTRHYQHFISLRASSAVSHSFLLLSPRVKYMWIDGCSILTLGNYCSRKSVIVCYNVVVNQWRRWNVPGHCPTSRRETTLCALDGYLYCLRFRHFGCEALRLNYGEVVRKASWTYGGALNNHAHHLRASGRTEKWECLQHFKAPGREYFQVGACEGEIYVLGGYSFTVVSNGEYVETPIFSGEVLDATEKQQGGEWRLVPELWPSQLFEKYDSPFLTPVTLIGRWLCAISSISSSIMYYEKDKKRWMPWIPIHGLLPKKRVKLDFFSMGSDVWILLPISLKGGPIAVWTAHLPNNDPLGMKSLKLITDDQITVTESPFQFTLHPKDDPCFFYDPFTFAFPSSTFSSCHKLNVTFSSRFHISTCYVNT